ncbi:MAG TPA: nucleotidyl transferase AbiEii/AbiGii toxin family protein [Gemmataceae bacterium]|jgi:hypothetical protein
MTDREATLAVIDALEALSIPYMVVGSLSSNVYGVPRSTQDADFVIQLGSESLSRLADHLGTAFRLDPQMTFETATLTRRHVLKVVGIPFTIELFHLGDDPHEQERFRRRRRIKTMGREVSMPTVEDVIITKLRWALTAQRSKDRNDVRDVIAVQGENIDWPYVHGWSDQHGTRALLDEIRHSIPPL